MEIQLEILGEKQISRNLLRLTDHAKNLRPLFEVLADDFYRIETEQFESEGSYASGHWRPLSAAYLARKIREGFDPRILHRTLKMRRSLTRRGAPGGVRKITSETIELGTRVTSKKGYPYPRAHQLGRSVPRRRPVEFRETDKRAWIKAVQRYVMTGEVAAR